MHFFTPSLSTVCVVSVHRFSAITAAPRYTGLSLNVIWLGNWRRMDKRSVCAPMEPGSVDALRLSTLQMKVLALNLMTLAYPLACLESAMPIVSELNIYPIKSTRRIALQQSRVEPRGLQWDRRWMLVDTDGKFVTARQWPRLAMVDTRLQDDELVVSATGVDPLRLPLADSGLGDQEVKIWRDRCPVSEVSMEANRWFSDYLGTLVRLVRLSDRDQRPVDPKYGSDGDQVSLADGFPLLLIGEGSLADLNSRLAQPVDMRRFRPNLVVDIDEPFAEDRWRRIRIAEVELELVKACSRCVFTTVDPDSGDKDPGMEPLRTLSSYRRRELGVFFGQNAIPRTTGVIRVGDWLEVLK